MFAIGYDIGSSSIKASLVDLQEGKAIHTVQYPEGEIEINSPKAAWAEQDPCVWWKYVVKTTKKLLIDTKVDAEDIKSIGVAYQMHGLVLVDKNLDVIRPSIIWCDSRAVDIGTKASEDLGNDYCLNYLLNSPGNFTASKLKWVKENEPHFYNQIYKIMLPGDYITMKFTGEISTTITGLSEGIFWNFKEHKIASRLLQYYGIDESVLPKYKNTFEISWPGFYSSCIRDWFVSWDFNYL